MKITLSYPKFVCLFLFLYTFFAVLCINAPKRVVFVLAIAISLPIILQYFRVESRIVFYGFIYPVALLLMSVVLTGDIASSFQRIYCLFAMLLILPIKYCNFDYEKYFVGFTKMICVFTLLIFALDISGIADVNQSNQIKNIVYDLGMGLMGKGAGASNYFTYSIFLYSNTLMLFLFFLHISRNEWIRALIVMGACLLTGTRTPIILCVVFGLIYFYFFNRSNNSRLLIKLIILFIAIAFLCFYISDIIASVHNLLFVAGQNSNRARISDFSAIISVFRKNPMVLLTGEGMGSSFYNPVRSRWYSDSELSYLNLIRMMGIPFFLVFLSMILLPFKYMRRDDPYFWAYICYLVQAGVNPFLFDSTAFLVYVFMYSKYVANRYPEEAIYG